MPRCVTSNVATAMQRGSLPRPAVGVMYTRHYLILTVIKACVHYGNCTAHQLFFNEALLYEVFLLNVCMCLYEDDLSVTRLRTIDPLLLERYSPRFVVGDGNCLYRALSLALLGTEDCHGYLRVRTAIEISSNQCLTIPTVPHLSCTICLF